MDVGVLTSTTAIVDWCDERLIGIAQAIVGGIDKALAILILLASSIVQSERAC